MQRRTAIKNLMIFAGGIAIMPSCSEEPGKASIQLDHIQINEAQEKLLAEIAETIIPKTTLPGAKELNLHLFTLKMVDDCYPAQEQQLFTNGLSAIDAFAKDTYGASFTKCKPEQRQELLMKVTNTKTPADIAAFLQITKQKVIQGFTNSKLLMTELKQYELVPGRYNGFFPVEKI